VQVLIDPQRRQVYDIYGREGLQAGLEVGAHLRTRDELRRQWQQFQQQQVGRLCVGGVL
jgi:DnaJ homolog subfamily C member 11